MLLILAVWLAVAPAAAQTVRLPAIRPLGAAPAIGLMAPSFSLPLTPRLSAPSLAPALPSALPPAGLAARIPAAHLAPAPAAAQSAGPLLSAGYKDVAFGGREYRLLLRRGMDEHGHLVLTLDALDKAALGQGAVGHVDFAVSGEHASADGPLDALVGPHGQPEDVVPAGADLTHWRAHMWFGLAVMPAHRGTGLGRGLMTEMAALLRAQGVRRVFIRATEGSRDFYHRLFGASVVYEEREAGAEDEYYQLEIVL